MAEIVRRRSFGAVLPLGRHISISGSRPVQCASDSIALSSFQEEQNARHYKQFKFEQALAGLWCLTLDHGAAQETGTPEPAPTQMRQHRLRVAQNPTIN